MGTVRANRREIPIGKANLNIHESEFFETTMEKGNVANLVRYQTKKKQICSSPQHDASWLCCDVKHKDETGQHRILQCNKCGVDLLDSMARMHSTKSPMRRWPMAVWCNILDLAGVNAWILFSKETGRKISR